LELELCAMRFVKRKKGVSREKTGKEKTTADPYRMTTKKRSRGKARR